MGMDLFTIHQLKDNDDTRGLRFETLDYLKKARLSVDWGNYKHVYTGEVARSGDTAMETLDALFIKFNLSRPEDFTGHSLSVSDIIVLHRDGNVIAHYADSFGFKEVPEFLTAPYKYYSTQRPVDIATYPKTEGGPAYFKNYDKRESCENATFRAWGYLAYDAPLTIKQMGDYELRAASDNPDNIRVSPYQFEAQLEVIGKWEIASGISDMARITWFHNDMGSFVKKDWIMLETVTDRFHGIVETKALAAEIRAEKKRFANYGLSDAPISPEIKRDMIVQAQLVGHWEELRRLPDGERYTWRKPSIDAFTLRDPVVAPEKLEQRYYQAIKELNREQVMQSRKKPISEQLAEAEKQVQRGADAPVRNKDKSHEDR